MYQFLLIQFIQFRFLFGAEIIGISGIFPCILQSILGIRNQALHASRNVLLVVKIEFFQAFLDHRQGIASVINDEIAIIHAQTFNFQPQKARAKSVEGTEPQLARHISHHFVNPLFHLQRGFVRKGNS